MICFRINLVQHTQFQQHDVDDTMTRNSDQGKALPPNTQGGQKAECGSRGSGEQMHNSNKERRGINKFTLHQPKNINLRRDTRETQYYAHGLRR